MGTCTKILSSLITRYRNLRIANHSIKKISRRKQTDIIMIKNINRYNCKDIDVAEI